MQNKKKYVIISILSIVLIAVCIFVLVKCTGIFSPDEDENTEHYIRLDHGLKITLLGSYDGMYTEDGTNEQVEDVISIVVLNTNKNDLQYAEIYLKYEDYTAEFTVSNLPSDESVLLLEKKRLKSNDEQPDVYLLENETFFKSPMDAKKDMIEVSGVNGVANIKNISGEDIAGDIVIDYKNYDNDMFYGGITYRITLRGGLKSKEIKQVNAGHFSPSTSKILSVNVVE